MHWENWITQWRAWSRRRLRRLPLGRVGAAEAQDLGGAEDLDFGLLGGGEDVRQFLLELGRLRGGQRAVAGQPLQLVDPRGVPLEPLVAEAPDPTRCGGDLAEGVALCLAA